MQTVKQLGDPITLTALQPGIDEGTEFGFESQTVFMSGPPLKLELVQFGEEVRINAEILDARGHANSAEGPVTLRLKEGEETRLEGEIHINNEGVGSLILSPDKVRSIRPESKQLRPEIEVQSE